MKLIVFKLTIKSSYLNNQEENADENAFDTLQWCFTETSTWRIKTFDIDQDIHIHEIGQVLEEVTIENSFKHYGDVIESKIVYEDVDNSSPEIEFAKGNNFAFWNPKGKTYKTKSNPA